MKPTKEDQEEALRALRRMLRPGAKVYTMITHVARSGMSRHVRVFAVCKWTRNDDGKKVTTHEITDITGYVANACGYRRASGSRWDIVIGGCGFDAGFQVVYNLGRALFPHGGPLAKSSSVRASQAELAAERAGKAPPTREENGGYLLKHERL